MWSVLWQRQVFLFLDLRKETTEEAEPTVRGRCPGNPHRQPCGAEGPPYPVLLLRLWSVPLTFCVQKASAGWGPKSKLLWF